VNAAEKSGSSSSLIITWRGVAWGAVTIVAMFIYLIIYTGMGAGSEGYVQSQYPMMAFIPFVLWLFLNTILAKISPRLALSQGELLTIFAMMWIVGVIPQWGWMEYWVALLATPAYMATPENQWADIFLTYMPWHVFPDSSPRVVESFWLGLSEGAPVPWDGWYAPLTQWFGVSIAMVVFGFSLVVLFQQHWVESEKLTFPLARMPLDLTQGFDGPRRMPDIFRSGLFWCGFALVFVPLLYNIFTYFTPGLPLSELWIKRYVLELPRPFGNLTIRLMAPVLALTYMCPLNILGSLFFFFLLAALKNGLMNQVGFSVGVSGQEISGGGILALESLGAVVFIAIWSVWLARGHLRKVWQQVRTGQGDATDVRLYRVALSALVLSAIYVIAWGVSLGASLPLAAGSFLMMVITFFVTIKLVAATGFPYLTPSWAYAKGDSFITELIGSANLSPQNLVAFKIFTSSMFFGNIRLPVWPALPHLLRIFSLRDQPKKIVALVLVAFPIGFMVAALATIEMAYDVGAANHLLVITGLYDQIAHMMLNPKVGDPGKWGIWLLGFSEAAVLAILRGRFYWFSLHPLGLAYQWTPGTSIYWFSLFLTWGCKLTILRYGGITAYRMGKPLFFGLGIGYVMGVVLSGIIDVIWFPGEIHVVHDW
jgi:hypothetical protein